MGGQLKIKIHLCVLPDKCAELTSAAPTSIARKAEDTEEADSW